MNQVEQPISKTHLHAPLEMLDQAHSALEALAELLVESDEPRINAVAQLLKSPLRDVCLAVLGLRNEVCPTGRYASEETFQQIREQIRTRIYCEMEDRM